VCAEVIAAVVLAAGASVRLGEPKQLVVIAGETLLERAVRTAREAGCAPVVVVLGAEAERMREQCDLGGAVVAVNEAWEEGMASSIRVGVGAVGGADGVLLMTCDQPAVTAEHLLALMAEGQVTASSYAGRRGVPAYFPAASFPALMELTGDAGARELLRGAATVELVGGELDVDTAADLAEAARLFR
jgi:CTP:molybdopterin cytidylyltransferase MocA